MFLNYDKLADFIEWVAEVENWPYFDNVSRNDDENIKVSISNYFKNNEEWVEIGFYNNDYGWNEYDFKLSTLNQLYNDYKDDKGIE